MFNGLKKKFEWIQNQVRDAIFFCENAQRRVENYERQLEQDYLDEEMAEDEEDDDDYEPDDEESESDDEEFKDDDDEDEEFGHDDADDDDDGFEESEHYRVIQIE